MILQAYAAKPGYTDSPVATAVYHTITTPVWTNVAGGSWADAVNWQSTVIAGGGGVSADFGALDLTADGTVTLDGARTIGNLIFGDTTPSHDWTLNSGTGGPLTLAAGASPVITVNNRKVTIGAELAGTGGFAKNGNGTLTLAAVNTYTGNIAVNSGTLECDAFAGTTSSTVGANATGRTLTVSPGATLVSNTADAVDFQSTVANNLAFVIQGVWNNNPAEAATGFQRVDNLTLQGGTINDYGQHAFNYGGILMANTVTVAGSAPSAYNQSGGGVGMGILNPTTFNVADVTGDADTDFIVNGLIRATAVNGQIGSLAKTGAGTMSISGACTYGGATTVNGGTFQVNGSLATGSVTVGVAGTLAGTGTIGGAVTVAGALHPGTTDIGVLTINNTLTLQAGSTTSMRIDKTGGLTTSDELFASTVNYGGALTVTATGEALAAGDTFFLFTANTRNGGFTTVDLPALAAPLTWDSSGLATDGTIRVVDTLPTPTFSPVAGGYVGGQTITITCTEPGTTIFYTYTTDETTPADPTIVSDSGTPGASTASVIVPVGTVKFIKAMAVKFGSVNSPVAQADFRTVATPVWIYDGSGIWSDDTNWQTGAIAQGAGVTADFSTLALTTSPTVALDSARTIGSLVFGDVGDSNGWTLNASGDSVLTLDNGASPSVITVANQTTTISASLLCLQGLTKAGGGTLAFTGLATGSAMDLSVENGTLRLARFSDGSATYGLPYDTAGGLANGGVITINPTATLIVANAYNLGHAQQIHINGGTLAITNSAGGDGQNYTLNLNFTGGGTINGPGSLRWGEMADATLTVNGVAPATINSDLWTISTNNKGGTIHIADPAGVLNFNGAIKPHTYSPAGGPVPLTKTGPGTLILAGTNTYTGATAVNGGTLTVSGSLGATEVTVANGAALGGNGNLGGTLTVHSGGRHTLAVAAAPGAQITRIIAGALTLDAGNILDLTATVTPGAGTYTLVTAGGGIAGTPTTVNLPVGVSGIVAVDGNDLVLTVSTAGGYDSWQDANGTTGTACADHDNDGVPNGVEYFIGGGNDTTGFTALPGVVNISGVRTVTYTRDRGYVGTYGTDFVIETSETLDGAWTPETIGGTVIQSGDNFTYSFPPVGPGRKFVRLSITVP